jgi:hypothetical protein
MAVPDFLNNGFRATLFAATADVADIITALNTELVTNGDWTDTGGAGTGPFKSPPNALDGSFVTVTLARISATRLSYIVYDSNGLLVNNATDTRQDIDAGGCAFYIFSGPDYFCVETERATAEVFLVARLNVWPDTPGMVRPSWVCTQGPRNNAGNLTSDAFHYWWYLTLTGTAYAGSGYPIVPRGIYSGTSNFITPSGAFVFAPADFETGDVLIGRLPQCVICYPSAFGSVMTVPIDTGVTGDFYILRLITSSYRRLAIRVA